MAAGDPDIAKICGPTLQSQIEEANKAILKLYVTAARLGSAEPLAATLLGVDQAFLDVFSTEVAGRESILADALEALIGAIYLDAGMDVARARVLAWLAGELDGLTLVDTNKDPKTRLQEFLQSRAAELPRYEVVDIQGEPHCRTFFVQCEVALLTDKTQGQGASRRIAEQVAAAAALVALGVENSHD